MAASDKRVIGLWGCIALTIGHVIGSGIFTSPTEIIRTTNSVCFHVLNVLVIYSVCLDWIDFICMALYRTFVFNRRLYIRWNSFNDSNQRVWSLLYEVYWVSQYSFLFCLLPNVPHLSNYNMSPSANFCSIFFGDVRYCFGEFKVQFLH